ncbi:MAG: hypothetical protein BWX77_00964 [Bacteroidetes bacterium ADurb.Bin090]|nr:MAG: hypothetical protein BWX77_00964 [Bacteroidetes bacterium ADurb.Bin090]
MSGSAAGVGVFAAGGQQAASVDFENTVAVYSVLAACGSRSYNKTSVHSQRSFGIQRIVVCAVTINIAVVQGHVAERFDAVVVGQYFDFSSVDTEAAVGIDAVAAGTSGAFYFDFTAGNSQVGIAFYTLGVRGVCAVNISNACSFDLNAAFFNKNLPFRIDAFAAFAGAQYVDACFCSRDLQVAVAFDSRCRREVGIFLIPGGVSLGRQIKTTSEEKHVSLTSQGFGSIALQLYYQSASINDQITGGIDTHAFFVRGCYGYTSLLYHNTGFNGRVRP